MNAEELGAAVTAARPGTPIIYHTGSLAYDRRYEGDVSGVAVKAMDLYERGLVRLTQNKLSGLDHYFDYIATRTHKAA